MINLKEYKFLGEVVYSAIQVNEIVKARILDLLIKYENMDNNKFWEIRSMLINDGKNFIKNNNLE